MVAGIAEKPWSVSDFILLPLPEGLATFTLFGWRELLW